jgi:hypothetical protein
LKIIGAFPLGGLSAKLPAGPAPQMRPTSRQRMQRLADELEAEGLVEFINNPKHLEAGAPYAQR